MKQEKETETQCFKMLSNKQCHRHTEAVRHQQPAVNTQPHTVPGRLIYNYVIYKDLFYRNQLTDIALLIFAVSPG